VLVPPTIKHVFGDNLKRISYKYRWTEWALVSRSTLAASFLRRKGDLRLPSIVGVGGPLSTHPLLGLGR